MSEKDELLKFLTHIWGTEEANIFLATKAGPNLFQPTPIQKWPERSETIAQFIIMGDAKMDMYYGMAHYKEGSTEKSKENAIGAKVLWVEMEGDNDGQADPKDALELIRKDGLIPSPTYRLQSSTENAQHWYWLLDKVYDKDIIQDLNRRLAYYLNADRACWNIDRVLRPPFTHNHKDKRRNDDGSHPPVDILEFTGSVFTADKFNTLPEVKEQIKEIIHFGDIPDIETVLAKYPWDDRHLEIFQSTKESFWNPTANDYEGRGNAMMRLAYFCCEMGMSDEALFAVINDLDKRWGKFEGRHDKDRRILEFFTRARNKYPSSVFVKEVQSTAPIQQIYGFKELLNAKFQFNWLVQDLIPENTINFLTATPGVGKSRLAIQLAASLATGEDFLSWSVVGKKKVVFFSLEMGLPMLQLFESKLAKENRYDLDVLEENLKVIPAGEPLPMASPDGAQFFKFVLEEVKPDVVIIDAMGSLSYDEINEKTAKDIMNRLKAMLNEYGVTFYIIHHNRKPSQLAGDKAPTLADFYGNTYGATDAASVLGLWRPPGKRHVELHSLKSRTGASHKPLFLKDDADKFTFSVMESIEDDTNDDQDGNPLLGLGF